MIEKTQIKKYILITIFAIIFGFVVQDGIRLVIQKFLEIPDAYVGFARWGDTFFLRILASLIGTSAGAFVIGTFLKKKARLIAVISTLPTSLFWMITLIFGMTIIANQEYMFETTKAVLLLPSILFVLSPVVGYVSAKWGQKYLNAFQKPKSILNIKWYHWLWIFPFYLNKVVAIPLFALTMLWMIDVNLSWGWGTNPLFELIFNFGNTVSRIIVFGVLAGLFASVYHAYLLLSEEKINWKNGIIIFGHVLLFSVFYVILFVV